MASSCVFKDARGGGWRLIRACGIGIEGKRQDPGGRM